MFSLSEFRRKSPFIGKCRERMRALRMSPRTEEAYVNYIADFLQWSGWTKPEALTTQQVTDYLSYLAIEKNCAASTQNVAEHALKFMFKHCLKRRKYRESDNLLTKAEIAKVIAGIPAKYIPHLKSCDTLRKLKKQAKETRSMHPNSPIYALHSASENAIERRITPNGFFHSKILHEIADGLSWKDAEKKHGKGKIKTVCADFVRQFAPKILEALQ
jgi:hypothetical protein